MKLPRKSLWIAPVAFVCAGAAIGAGLASQPESPFSPIGPQRDRSLSVPPGQYTSIVLADPTSRTRSAKLFVGNETYTIIVPEQNTVVLPMGGVAIGRGSTLSFDAAGTEISAWGITPGGLMLFEEDK